MPTYCDVQVPAALKGPTRPHGFCPHPAHVVLFAPADLHFAGQVYARGDRVLLCLRHGGQVYDARHGRRTAEWLQDAIDTNSLPVVRLPHHRDPSPLAVGRWNTRPPKR